MNISITSTSLHFREGNSDKEYHVAVEPEGEGYIVTYAYGRRGNTLTTGRKTQHIVTLAQANKIHDQLVREKTAKGYRPVGETRQPDRTSDNDGQDSGIRCQLLNPVEETELDRLLGNNTHCLQEKHDGRRLMIRKKGNKITGINRRGLLIPIPEPIRHAFEEVDGHFRVLFTRLFEGGAAHLALVDSDDPLEAGLEIYAQPPGKRLQSLSLLSGGEQALTATALIFALFLTNPAPICVLDEVDAPLDDANVERFCDLLDSMVRTTTTRYLIVTHNAVTMSRMHRLFGVTMAERGISRLVSVDLGEAALMAAE